MPTTTRKLPCSPKADGSASSRSEHLIPTFLNHEPYFVGLRSGKKFPHGIVSFIGKDVSSEDIIKRLSLSPDQRESVVLLLVEYLQQLQSFKIGNVLSVSWSGVPKRLKLRLIKEHPSSSKKLPKLPK
nr:putative integron gene cassette protein [uncultured bacterium]